MHERGYRFIGPTSFYRLTLQEMRTLEAGFEVTKQLEEDEAKGISSGDRRRFNEFNNQLKKS